MSAKWRCKACGHTGLMIYRTVMDFYVGTNEAEPKPVEACPRWMVERGVGEEEAARRKRPVRCPQCKAGGRERFEEIG